MSDTGNPPTAVASCIVLVGPMGAGKSTVGRKLASMLGRSFQDSDSVIVDRTGANIPLIFEIEGEEGFRRREAQIIEELCQQTDLVLATGGGAILREENRRQMNRYGFVVYLHASVEQQLKRAGRDQNRPLLQNDDPEGTLRSLFAIRDPLYRDTADLIVETDNQTVHSVARKIRSALSSA